MAIALIAVSAVLAAGAARADGARASERVSVLGRSVEGRPLVLVRTGARRAATRVLVVGAIHGNEPAGRAVTQRLRALRPPRGVEMWLLSTVNPDGIARGTRQNARGVDLNRNFPARWRLQGRPGSTFYSGPQPLSEPESRLAARLIRRLRPAVTIWYHQALALVDAQSGADRRLVWTYARAADLPVRRISGLLPGIATRWQNTALPGTSAFVVELPAGRLDAVARARHARAVLRVAARAARG